VSNDSGEAEVERSPSNMKAGMRQPKLPSISLEQARKSVIGSSG